DAVVVSSHGLGWQNIRVAHVRHYGGGMAPPPLTDHLVIIQIESSLRVCARIDGKSFDQRLQPGEITIIPAGASSVWRWEEGGVNNALHLYLSPSFVRATAEECGINQNQIVIRAKFGASDEPLRHIGLSLLRELDVAKVMGRFYADSLASVFAMRLARRHSLLKDAQISKGGMAPGKLRKAIEFMNENLEQEEDFALAAVADAAGMSYFHFSRAFKQSMGVSPNNYLVERRIDRARKLLAETELPIAE